MSTLSVQTLVSRRFSVFPLSLLTEPIWASRSWRRCYTWAAATCSMFSLPATRYVKSWQGLLHGRGRRRLLPTKVREHTKLPSIIFKSHPFMSLAPVFIHLCVLIVSLVLTHHLLSLFFSVLYLTSFVLSPPFPTHCLFPLTLSSEHFPLEKTNQPNKSQTNDMVYSIPLSTPTPTGQLFFICSVFVFSCAIPKYWVDSKDTRTECTSFGDMYLLWLHFLHVPWSITRGRKSWGGAL